MQKIIHESALYVGSKLRPQSDGSASGGASRGKGAEALVVAAREAPNADPDLNPRSPVRGSASGTIISRFILNDICV